METERHFKYKRDAITSIVIIIIAFAVYLFLIPAFIEDSDVGGMSPRFFPQFGAVIIGLFSVCLLMSSLFSLNSLKTSLQGKPDQANEESKAIKQNNMTRSMSTLATPCIVVVILMLFCIGFERVGYLITAPLTVLAMMLVFGQRRVPVLLLVSVAISALLFVAFEYGLNLPLS